MKGHTMAIKRVQSNIINLAFTVSTEDGKSGVQINQAIVNGVSGGVQLRTMNGARKSAMINLDTSSLEDLRDALTEILGGEEN